MSNKIESFVHNPATPVDSGADVYRNIGMGVMTAQEYTGWRNEVMSWKEDCYIGTSLTPCPHYRLKGPDVCKFLSHYLVNDMEKFEVGRGKHGIMCNEKGTIMVDGVILRTAEDEFETIFMTPYINYCCEKTNLNVKGEDITGQMFLFQVAGPTSLAILNEATGQDLSELKFVRFCPAVIDGVPVRIFRLGMAGTLSFEVHGDFNDGQQVYNAIWETGQKHGLRKLGNRAYLLNHTENGFPQAYMHYTYPWWSDEDPDFKKWLIDTHNPIGELQRINHTFGSVGADMDLYYRNPIELGWESCISFNHDFVGKEALAAMKANPTKKTVTLEWNVEDILDVHRSQYEAGEPYRDMDDPHNHCMLHGHGALYADKVMKNGKMVGISSGRIYSYYYRQMISLCPIDIEHSEIGTDVTIIWGDEGHRQKEIRAKVARFPYLDLKRNSDS